ncbi:MAG TPA: hypothetical protein VFJ29_07930 [Candidatus Kapabacteria bacterium]|nr:hypothetical protein [Candidatus Kapabacteria bacterium]
MFRSLWKKLLWGIAIILAMSHSAFGGGGWVDAPGEGWLRLGYDIKHQPDGMRRDVNGIPYQAEYTLTHTYAFAYLAGDVGILPGLQGSFLVQYLWAAERVDPTDEDPSRFYRGFTDMYAGLTYQLWAGEYPTAVGLNVRMPYLYQAGSYINGQPATNISGLLNHDYDFTVASSHSFNNGAYVSAMGGFRYREGAFAHQILGEAEVGDRPSYAFLDNRLFLKAAFDGAFSIGSDLAPEYTTDRFLSPGLDGSHFFDYNKASYIRAMLVAAVDVMPKTTIQGGIIWDLWGISIDIYHELFAEVGYNF